MGGARFEITAGRLALRPTPFRRQRGRAFGFDEAADTAGAVVGPLVALAIVGLAPGGAAGIKSYNVIGWPRSPGFWPRFRLSRWSASARIQF